MENMPHVDVGTPEQLIELARNGGMSKEALVRLLALEKRQSYLDACAAIERQYTQACGASGSPCLEGGCALEGEVCLQPLLRAEAEYLQACGHVWATLFADQRNRAEPCRI